MELGKLKDVFFRAPRPASAEKVITQLDNLTPSNYVSQSLNDFKLDNPGMDNTDFAKQMAIKMARTGEALDAIAYARVKNESHLDGVYSMEDTLRLGIVSARKSIFSAENGNTVYGDTSTIKADRQRIADYKNALQELRTNPIHVEVPQGDTYIPPNRPVVVREPQPAFGDD